MCAIFTAMMSITSSFPVLVVLRMLNGFALGTLTPVVQSLVSEETPRTQHGWQFGCLNFAANVGTIIATLTVTGISNRIVFGISGWRFGFMIVAALSLCMAFFVFSTMYERPRDFKIHEVGCLVELRKFATYLTLPTFQVIVIQGIVGSIPWAAAPFCTLYLQYIGFSDFFAGSLVALNMVGVAFGNLLGGSIGDRLSIWSPAHGRALTAQMSIFLGLIMATILFLVIPPSASLGLPFGIVYFLMGLVDSWCASGCNQPIFIQIVPADSRASALAWDRVLEAGISSVVGPSSVALLSQHLFGYKPTRMSVSRMSPAARLQNARALGHSLALCHILPWFLCLIFYSFLHITYHRDVKRRAKTDDQYPFESGQIGPKILSSVD